MERFWIERDWQVDVESSEMREELGLRYYRYYLDQGAEQMTSEPTFPISTLLGVS